MESVGIGFWGDSEDGHEKLGRISSPDFVARQLVKGLYSGRYVAGQRLVESDLTKEFGVSRGSVRDALKRLASEGVISITMHSGACIRSFTKKEAIDVVRVFESLLTLAVEQATKRVSEGASKADLREELYALEQIGRDEDYFELVAGQNAVYREIVRLSGNREIARAIPVLHMRFIQNPYRSSSPRLAREALFELRAIVDSIFDGDGSAAVLAARKHIQQGMAQLEALPAAAFASHSDLDKVL